MPAARPRRHRTLALAACTALLVAACGASGPIPTGPAATSVPTSAPSTTGAAGTAAGPAEPCATTPTSACSQFGGDYRSTRFEGGVSYHLVGDEWTNVANEPTALILQAGTTGFGGAANQWLVLVHGAPILPNDGSGSGTPDAALAQSMLAQLAGLQVTPVGNPTPIDGQAGVVFRVANTSGAPVPLFTYPRNAVPGGFVLAGDATAEIHWLTIDGGPVLVIIAAPSNKLDGTLADIDGTLRSIDFD